MSNLTDGTTPITPLDLPDLSDVLAQIDFTKRPIDHGKTANQGHFHVGKWGSLIIELIAYPNDKASVLEAYGLSEYQYECLLGNPLFQRVYKDTESSIISMATSGGFQLSARRVAEQGLTVLEDIIASGEDKDRLKAIEMAANLANLNPLIQAKLKQDNQVVNTGVQLVVNFGGGLTPPKAFNGAEQTVIDVKAEDISEVE